MKIAIIRSAGSPQATQIFQGVFGTLERQLDPATGELQPNAKFTVDPELLPVSQLFGHLDAAGVVIASSGVDVIDVPDDLAEPFKASLMQALSARWESMYAGLQNGTQADHLTVHMLRSESRQVLAGAQAMLRRAQMRPFRLTGRIAAHTGSAYSEDHGQGVSTRELMAVLLNSLGELQDAELTIDAAEQLDEQLLGHDFSTERHQALHASAEYQNRMEAPAPSFDGSNIEVKADLIMEFATVGRNVAQASRILHYIFNENSMREMGISRFLTATPVALENVRSERIAQQESTALQAPQVPQIEQARQGENDRDEGDEGGDEPQRPRLIY